MDKILIVFGTRPEAIKMAPVIREFELHKHRFQTITCVTAQHREMLDQVLNLFEISPHYDLNVMTCNQTLSELTGRLVTGVNEIIEKERPDMILVQGDTTTTFASALSAYYNKITIGHIEAGLRTNNKYSPFPEEINRRLTTTLSDFHFAPTQAAKENLIREGIPESTVFITGNTVIDALKWVVKKHKKQSEIKKWSDFFMEHYNISLSNHIRTILVTGHRRENFGQGFQRICNALAILAKGNLNIQLIYPVHLNPNVQEPVYSILKNVQNVHLIPPLEYEPFIFLLNSSYLALTDSGGIQEEAPCLGKPVLVMRDTTERPEGIEAGTAKLVGTDTSQIVEETERLLKNSAEYASLSKAVNPYGDGTASKRIVELISKVIK